MKFKPNEGPLDRAIRLIGGTVLLIWGLTAPSWIMIVLGGVAVVTGATGFCGLYRLVGINTCQITPGKIKKKADK